MWLVEEIGPPIDWCRLHYWLVSKEVVKIRHPKATRPWQHVRPIRYLTLAARLRSQSKMHGEAFNFGPGLEHDFDVSDVINCMAQRWGAGANVISSEPGLGAPEAGLLRLNCDKAMSHLVAPCTRFWDYHKYDCWLVPEVLRNSQSSMMDYSLQQLDEYISRAGDRGLVGLFDSKIHEWLHSTRKESVKLVFVELWLLVSLPLYLSWSEGMTLDEKISELISGVRLTKINKFCVPEGDVLRGLRTDDQGFDDLWKHYFSSSNLVFLRLSAIKKQLWICLFRSA